MWDQRGEAVMAFDQQWSRAHVSFFSIALFLVSAISIVFLNKLLYRACRSSGFLAQHDIDSASLLVRLSLGVCMICSPGYPDGWGEVEQT